MSPTDTPPDLNSTSYSELSMGTTLDDPFLAGEHCSFCRQLDFLPFRCDSCKAVLCKDCRTEDAHLCPRKGAWAKSRAPVSTPAAAAAASSKKPTILTHETQCSHPQCKTLIDTPLLQGVHCTDCKRRYCLKHRHKEEHDCAKLAPSGAKSDRGLGDALSRLRSWGASKRSSQPAAAPSTASKSPAKAAASTPLQRIVSPFTARKSNKPSSQIVAVNALRRTAKGDAKIPADRRLYVHLEAVGEGEGHAGAKVPKADAFYDVNWSVGKVLDSIAKTLAIENINNKEITEEQRLRVFWIEGGRLLGFSEKLGAVTSDGGSEGSGTRSGAGTKMSSGHTLILLRGVGPLDG